MSEVMAQPAPASRTLAEVFGALLAGSAPHAAELPEVAAELTRMMSRSLSALAPHREVIAPRALSKDVLVATVQNAGDGELLLLAELQSGRMVVLEPSAIKTLAAILCGAVRPPILSGEPTALERRIVDAWVQSLGRIDQALVVVEDRKMRQTLQQRLLTQPMEGLALALHDARGHGHAPVIQCLAPTAAAAVPEAPPPSLEDVQARLGHASVPVAHRAAFGLKPLSLLHALRPGDVLDVGTLAATAVRGEVRGIASHKGSLVVRAVGSNGTPELACLISERLAS
jgi:hypothetical protein